MINTESEFYYEEESKINRKERNKLNDAIESLNSVSK
jgi:hypothetical protein